ncbi:hypothetical protein WJX84_011731 [Apatococcus fuscideae]|uniref:PARP-type domain-containing protein n=1 Tax=Apatococcus fuscideae TaxID=2026836 RepID=A0AAW1TGU5_9CHLO
MAEEPKPALVFDKAKSGRSTCRATGEKIEKDEFRVGMEAWISGRMSTTWQKPVPFLEACHVEECAGRSSNYGTDKAKNHKFKRGQVRFICSSLDKKLYLTLESAASLLKPILEELGARKFGALSFKGLEELHEGHRKEFFEAFGVEDKAAVKFNKQHPPPEAPSDEEEGPDSGDDADHEPGQPASKKQKRQPGAIGKENHKASGAKATPASPPPQLTEYEQQRQEQIARNRERLMALGLPDLVQSAVPDRPKQPARTKGISAKKRREKEDPGPRRASLRQRGVAADGSRVDEELRGGKVTIINGEVLREPAGNSRHREPSPPKERHAKGLLAFESANGTKRSDAAFLELLRKETGTGKSDSTPTLAQIQKLKLKETDIAKVCKNGITHLAFHPGSAALIVATADKSGNLGLWSIDHQPQALKREELDKEEEGPKAGQEEEEEGEDDGVLELNPHGSYICGLRWAGGTGAAACLFTCSYDGSVRMLDPAAGSFQLVLSDEEAEFSAFDCTADGATAFLGDKDGNIEVLDVRAGKTVQEGVNLHPKKINTVHVEPNEEQLLVTASADNSVAIWDVRKLGKGGKPVSSATHSLTCQSAYFAPDGSQRVLTTSRDDTLRVWDGKKDLAQAVSIKHYNNTGRWVSPFRSVWGPAADTILCGSMKRNIDMYGSDGAQAAAMNSEHMTAIASRNAVHPFLPALAAGTASGRVHIYR